MVEAPVRLLAGVAIPAMLLGVVITAPLPMAHNIFLHATRYRVGEAVGRGLALDAAVAGSPAQRAGLWTLREGVSEAQNAAGPSLKHDVTVPIGALPGFVERTAALLERALPGVRLVTYGHVGDGNLHHNLTAPVGADPAAFEARAGELSRIVYDEVAAASGSISAEHGLGTANRDAAASYKDPVELALMRTVKDALDPRGLMNPGKVLAERPRP